MNRVVTFGDTEKSKIYQTVLSSPGMNEKCKINLIMSRQNILLLSRLIESGLLAEKGFFEDELIASLPEDSVEEFKNIHGEILRKAGLTEFYERMKLL